MASRIDLDGREWELPPNVGISSLSAVMSRAQVLDELGPSGLLGYVSLACTSTKGEAMKLLAERFGYDRARAGAAVSLAAHLRPESSNNEPVGQIADVKVSRVQAEFVAGLLQTVDDGNPSPAPGINHAAIGRLWRQGRLQRFAKVAVQSGDPSVALVGAALMAANRTQGDLVARLTEAQFHTLMGRGTRQRRQVGRVLAPAMRSRP